LSATQAVSVTGWPADRWRWAWSKWTLSSPSQEWVSSFLTARRHIRGYSVPYSWMRSMMKSCRSRRWAVQVRVFTLHTRAG